VESAQGHFLVWQDLPRRVQVGFNGEGSGDQKTSGILTNFWPAFSYSATNEAIVTFNHQPLPNHIPSGSPADFQL